MRRSAAGALLAVLTTAGCVHLFQPLTYTIRSETLAIAQDEYLAKDLVRGLPEEVFRRWYLGATDWNDPLRPSILAVETRGDETVYSIGEGSAQIAEVAFDRGRLDHWTRWTLVQESVVSAWRRDTITPREVDDDTLARIVTRDPVSEAVRPETRPDPRDQCPLHVGDRMISMTPLAFDRGRGNRVGVGPEPAPGNAGLLPAGSILTIGAWNPATGRILRDEGGTAYHLESPQTLANLAAALGPAGRAVPLGQEAIVTSDLLLAIDESRRTAPMAVLPGTSRIPVWMTRLPPLRAGARVRVLHWQPCVDLRAEVEVPERAGEVDGPVRYHVPVAPAGLFVPADAAGGGAEVAGTGGGS